MGQGGELQAGIGETRHGDINPSCFDCPARLNENYA